MSSVCLSFDENFLVFVFFLHLNCQIETERDTERERRQCEREQNTICVDNMIMGPSFWLKSGYLKRVSITQGTIVRDLEMHCSFPST